MTGASGYIGSRLTEFAIREGYTVHGLSHSAAGCARLRSLGAVAVEGDLTSYSLLRSEASQADIVIHLAKVMSIDAQVVDALAEGLATSKSSSTAKPKLFIETSGTAIVAPDENDGETDETAPEHPNPLNRRIDCERYALSKAYTKTKTEDGKDSGSGIKVVALRLPPFVYGHGGSGVKLFLEIYAQKTGYVVRVGDGCAKTSVVHVDDAARGYLLVCKQYLHATARLNDNDSPSSSGTRKNENENENKNSEIYNLTSSTEVTFRELTDAMAHVLDLPVREMSAEQAGNVTGGILVPAFLTLRNRSKSDKARRELGWNPVEVGIIEDITRGSYMEVARGAKATAEVKA